MVLSIYSSARVPGWLTALVPGWFDRALASTTHRSPTASGQSMNPKPPLSKRQSNRRASEAAKDGGVKREATSAEVSWNISRTPEN